MIRDLSDLFFSGSVTLHSGDTRVEIACSEGCLEIHVPPGQGIRKIFSLRKKTPPLSGVPIPFFLTGSIPVFVFNRPLLSMTLHPDPEKKVSWKLTPLKFLRGRAS